MYQTSLKTNLLPLLGKLNWYLSRYEEGLFYFHMAKDTFYFSHDYNARTDDKIKKLIRKHGMKGYGIFWAVVEDLYNNANALHLDYEGIAYELREDSECIKSIINDFELFEIENDLFGSRSVEKRLDERNSKSVKARESAHRRWNKNKKHANALRTQSEGNAIKESKERKGDDEELSTTSSFSHVRQPELIEHEKNTIKYHYENFMLTDNHQKNALCMANRKTKKEVEIGMIGFILHLLSTGVKLTDSKPDFQSHFKSWFVKFGIDNLMKIDKDQIQAQFKKLNLYQDDATN